MALAFLGSDVLHDGMDRRFGRFQLTIFPTSPTTTLLMERSVQLPV